MSLILGGASAFVGALTGVACLAWWLASKFNHVYRKIDAHELEDIKRFNDMKMDVLEAKIQAQTIEAIKSPLR